jgi:hypothetical protein
VAGHGEQGRPHPGVELVEAELAARLVHLPLDLRDQGLALAAVFGRLRAGGGKREDSEEGEEEGSASSFRARLALCPRGTAASATST